MPQSLRRLRLRLTIWYAGTFLVILALLGIADSGHFDGRVLAEALENGPDAEQIAVDTRVHIAEAGAYRAAIQVSEIDGRRYVDKSWRVH